MVGDAENLQFKDDTFDIVVNTALLQYFNNPKKIIDEMHRVLKVNGYALVEVPYKYGIYNLKSVVKHFTSKDDFGKEPINRCYSKKEFTKLFKKYKIIKIHNFYNTLLIGIFQKIY